MRRAAAVTLVLICLVAILIPLLSPFDGISQDRLRALSAPDRSHLLGTDALGRDELVRLALAIRVSLLAGCMATALALSIGAAVGAIAGFWGGWRDALAMRTGELVLSLPWFYLIVGVRALLPLTLSPAAAILMIGLAAGLTAWPRPCRLIRGIVRSERERDFVTAARGFGASNAYLLKRHVLPAAYPVIAVQAALLIPQFVLAEATLSFLGLGVGEPAASLGNMIAALKDFHVLASCPWMLTPALALILISASFQAVAAE